MSKFMLYLQEAYALPFEVATRLDELAGDFFDKNAHHLTSFLEESSAFLKLRKVDPKSVPLASDAMKEDPHTHFVQYEDASLRVLWAEVEPYGVVPLHTHQWPGLLVVISTTRFAITHGATGEIEMEEAPLPLGIYRIPGTSILHGYKNLEKKRFKALYFELKQNSCCRVAIQKH